jgi:ribosomal protein L11 methyltransferase
MNRRTQNLETVFVTVPRAAIDIFEAALTAHCRTIGIFEADDEGVNWRIEGVREIGDDQELLGALMLAEMLSGVTAPLSRQATDAEGWLARVHAAFPEQHIGENFVIRGTHLPPSPAWGRKILRIDAGLAFGSGEHGSSRGCLRAFEIIAKRTKKRRILDVGCGSGILAMGAATILHRPVLAVDIDPWSVKVTRENARQNGLHTLIHPVLGTGLANRDVRRNRPYDLIFANILARPLCRMARDIGIATAPGGHVILAGLLANQSRLVQAAYRRQNFRLILQLTEGPWATLLLQK